MAENSGKWRRERKGEKEGLGEGGTFASSLIKL